MKYRETKGICELDTRSQWKHLTPAMFASRFKALPDLISFVALCWGEKNHLEHDSCQFLQLVPSFNVKIYSNVTSSEKPPLTTALPLFGPAPVVLCSTSWHYFLHSSCHLMSHIWCSLGYGISILFLPLPNPTMSEVPPGEDLEVLCTRQQLMLNTSLWNSLICFLCRWGTETPRGGVILPGNSESSK
jgi:hypothetical protein